MAKAIPTIDEDQNRGWPKHSHEALYWVVLGIELLIMTVNGK